MMTPELTALICVLLVQIAAIAAAGFAMTRELGPRYNAGPRDSTPEGSPLLGRLRRAVSNGFEGLALFAPPALIIGLTGQSDPLTATAAWIYVAARSLYIPAYALGLTPWRSVIWGAGFAATLTLLLSALF